VSAPLPLVVPKGYRLVSALGDDQTLTVTMATTRRWAACPACRRRSRRVHSRYLRVLADLPGNGRTVLLRIRARRFFCRRQGCPQRIFVERLADFAEVAARRTDRLRASLTEIGFAVGGRPGSRLAQRLEMCTSPSTLIRLVKAAPCSGATTSLALGVDEFAFKKGHRYGTILVDLALRRPIDLLPDRSAESLAKWLQAHPGVAVIARDRSALFAEGARTGAPDAIQVADRWHLIKNLADGLEPFLGRHRRDLRAAVGEAPPAILDQAVAPELDGPVPSPEVEDEAQSAATQPPRSRAERDKQWRRARRLERYEQVLDFHQQGFSLRAIGRMIDLDRRTVQRFVQSGSFPEISVRARRSSVVDPWATFIRQRWEEGCHNATQIFREMKGQGYSGERSQVMRYVGELKKQRREGAGNHAIGQLQRKERPPAARSVVWWVIREASDLKAEERAYLDRLCGLSEPIKQVFNLAGTFLKMVRERQADGLPRWLEAASQCGAPELRSLAKSLRGDLAAVTAALSLPWSNGPTEGNVHRLKMIKRQMYGRAGFELLRRRVLHFG
jgi:transposase